MILYFLKLIKHNKDKAKKKKMTVATVDYTNIPVLWLYQTIYLATTILKIGGLNLFRPHFTCQSFDPYFTQYLPWMRNLLVGDYHVHFWCHQVTVHFSINDMSLCAYFDQFENLTAKLFGEHTIWNAWEIMMSRIRDIRVMFSMLDTGIWIIYLNICTQISHSARECTPLTISYHWLCLLQINAFI